MNKNTILVITTLDFDRPGVVNVITHHVSICSCNIEDSPLTTLGKFHHTLFWGERIPLPS
ncbi:MAG: ACT domain-containing protein [Candidatus Malihini olakiniferum]